MVDGPYPSGVVGDDVPTFSVPVVDDSVEQGHMLQSVVIRMHQGDRATGCILGAENLVPIRRDLIGRHDIDEPVRGVLGDPQLAHAWTRWSIVSPDGRWNQIEPQHSVDVMCGDLPATQGPVGKVPQWTFSLLRLVHTLQ